MLEREIPDATLQNIAREFNLSETVFISRRSLGYDIRWFTPTLEVDLVGHATLAAAYVIMAELEPGQTEVEFHSRRSGFLRAYGDRALVSIELPSDTLHPCETPTALLSGLGLSPARVLKGRHYVAVMNDAAEVRSIHPKFPELMRLDRPTIAVTAPDTETDYVLRFFAPANGVPEDPVSGVAQCSLVPFWAAEYKRKKLKSRQLSERGGIMDCELKGRSCRHIGALRPGRARETRLRGRILTRAVRHDQSMMVDSGTFCISTLCISKLTITYCIQASERSSPVTFWSVEAE